MKKYSKLPIVIILNLALLLLFFIFGNQLFNDDYQTMKITMINRSKYGKHENIISKGALSAANEFGVELQILAPDYDKDAAAQINLLKSCVKDKEDTVILTPIDSAALNETIKELTETRLSIFSVKSNEGIEGCTSYIGTDHYKAGKEMGDLIVKAVGKKGRIVLFTMKHEPQEVKKKREGIMNYIMENSSIDVKVFECYTNDNTRIVKIMEDAIDSGDYECIVGMDETFTKCISVALKGKYVEMHAFGFDLTDEVIESLEQGYMDGVIVENYFAMGYMAVEKAVKLKYGEKVLPVVHIPTILVDKEKLLDEGIQKAVIPLD